VKKKGLPSTESASLQCDALSMRKVYNLKLNKKKECRIRTLFCVEFNTECFSFIRVYLNMGSKKRFMLIGLEPTYNAFLNNN
jgi:hypothetical protein